MPSDSYEYAIIRVVPRVERQEFLNAGVLLHCRAHGFLQAKIELDEERLRAFAPCADVTVIQEYLNLIPLLCAGGAAAATMGRLSQRERFHWLVAPRSTMVQLSPPHTGLCHDPERALEHLMNTMVRALPTVEMRAGVTPR